MHHPRPLFDTTCFRPYPVHTCIRTGLQVSSLRFHPAQPRREIRQIKHARRRVIAPDAQPWESWVGALIRPRSMFAVWRERERVRETSMRMWDEHGACGDAHERCPMRRSVIGLLALRTSGRRGGVDRHDPLYRFILTNTSHSHPREATSHCGSTGREPSMEPMEVPNRRELQLKCSTRHAR